MKAWKASKYKHNFYVKLISEREEEFIKHDSMVKHGSLAAVSV